MHPAVIFFPAAVIGAYYFLKKRQRRGYLNLTDSGHISSRTYRRRDFTPRQFSSPGVRPEEPIPESKIDNLFQQKETRGTVDLEEIESKYKYPPREPEDIFSTSEQPSSDDSLWPAPTAPETSQTSFNQSRFDAAERRPRPMGLGAPITPSGSPGPAQDPGTNEAFERSMGYFRKEDSDKPIPKKEKKDDEWQPMGLFGKL